MSMSENLQLQVLSVTSSKGQYNLIIHLLSTLIDTYNIPVVLKHGDRNMQGLLYSIWILAVYANVILYTLLRS